MRSLLFAGYPDLENPSRVHEAAAVALTAETAVDRVHPMLLTPLGANPLVSVLISCHNYQRFVGECLDTVLRQTYPHLEIIVADDGSRDQSREVVAAIASREPRVTLISRPHGGMAAALNAAWDVCRGEVICLLDADDTFHPDKLATVVAAFTAHPRAGFLIHRSVRTDLVGHPRGVLPLLGSLPAGWCLAESLVHGGILPNIPPTSNMAIRRQIGEALFPLPAEFTGFAERIIQRLAPLMTELCSIDRALATWRLHGDNDANAARMNLERMARDLAVMERLWDIQMEYLVEHEPELASSLAPLSHSDYYSRLRYLHERFTGGPQTAPYLRAFLESPGFYARPHFERWFWRLAGRLPDAVVSTLGNWIITQGRTKQLLGRLLRVEA